jgi:Ala-tRNA(Pro) deacylase
MTMPARLKAHLDQAHAAYFPIRHIPARSSQYAASLIHIPGKQVAKTVALRSGKQILLAVLPASYHVNLERLAAVVGKPVKLIDEQECYQLFPDCQPGAIPPFGELYGLPVYLDETLAKAPEIVFSAGTLSDGIRMGNTDFVRVVKPRICSFAEGGEEVVSKDLSEELLVHEEGGGK